MIGKEEKDLITKSNMMISIERIDLFFGQCLKRNNPNKHFLGQE